MTRSFISIWGSEMELTAILFSIPWDQIVIQTINGIVTGMILALIASGLTLIFGIMDVVNFAHGELFMLGAYVGVVVFAMTGNFWVALILSTVIVGLSAALIGLFWVFLKQSKFGVWIRATTQDRVMAQAMGIPVPWVYTGVFAIGAGLAAASGVLFAPMAGVSHTMGLDWVLKAFIVVVVGGMGNLGGSIAAAIFISLLESYASIWVNPSQAVIVSFVVLILTLLFRPTGLFVPTPK